MEFKRIAFTNHAKLRAIERSFELSKIREVIERGFHCDSELNSSKKLCIYKLGEQYYTIVYKPIGEFALIITVSFSSPKQIKLAEGRWKE